MWRDALRCARRRWRRALRHLLPLLRLPPRARRHERRRVVHGSARELRVDVRAAAVDVLLFDVLLSARALHAALRSLLLRARLPLCERWRRKVDRSKF